MLTTAPQPRHAVFHSTALRGDGSVKHRSDFNLNLRTTVGIDWQAKVMASDNPSGGFGQFAGTATATSATSLTATGTPFTASALIDHLIWTTTATGLLTYGVVTANTTSVATVDRWYDPTTPSGTALTPGATNKYSVSPATTAAVYLAVTADNVAPNAADTTLTSEIAGGDGLSRAFWSAYAHTPGTATVTITKTFTATSTKTVNKEAVFTALTNGTMPFESLETSPPTLVSGDTLVQNVQISY